MKTNFTNNFVVVEEEGEEETIDWINQSTDLGRGEEIIIIERTNIVTNISTCLCSSFYLPLSFLSP